MVLRPCEPSRTGTCARAGRQAVHLVVGLSRVMRRVCRQGELVEACPGVVRGLALVHAEKGTPRGGRVIVTSPGFLPTAAGLARFTGFGGGFLVTAGEDIDR
jgi:hypothetical protein